MAGLFIGMTSAFNNHYIARRDCIHIISVIHNTSTFPNLNIRLRLKVKLDCMFIMFILAKKKQY